MLPLVELPGGLDGNVHLVGLFQRVPQSSDSTLQERGVRHIKLEVVLVQQLASSLCFGSTLRGKRAVIPSGKLVLVVPGRFTMAEEHQLKAFLATGHGSQGASGTKWLTTKTTDVCNSSDQHYQS